MPEYAHATQTSPQGSLAVTAEAGRQGAKARLVDFRFTERPNSKLRVEGIFRLELCLSARHRSARACFRDQWPSNRFERIGALFVVPPEFDLLVRSDECTPLTSILFELNAEYVYQLFDRRPVLSDRRLVATLDVQSARLQRLLVRAGEEARRPGFASDFMIDLLAHEMSVELVRYGDDVILARTEGKGGLAPWQLRLIDDRLEQTGPRPSLGELALLCCVSARQLSRAFRASKQCSIGAYVAQRQIEHAKRMLSAGSTVTDIADVLGFSSASNFGLAFKKATGLTPGAFRKALRN